MLIQVVGPGFSANSFSPFASPVRGLRPPIDAKPFAQDMKAWHVGGLALLQAVGAWLFARGFFPFASAPPGFAARPAPSVAKPFDRLVFVVIDALRQCVASCTPTCGTRSLL